MDIIEHLQGYGIKIVVTSCDESSLTIGESFARSEPKVKVRVLSPNGSLVRLARSPQEEQWVKNQEMEYVENMELPIHDYNILDAVKRAFKCFFAKPDSYILWVDGSMAQLDLSDEEFYIDLESEKFNALEIM